MKIYPIVMKKKEKAGKVRCFLGQNIKWRAVDEALLSSLENVSALALDGVEIKLFLANFLPGITKKGAKNGNHTHEIIHIQFVLEGSFRFCTEKYSAVLKANQGIIIPAETLHRWSCEQDGILFGASIGVTGALAKYFVAHVKHKARISFIPCSGKDQSEGLLRIINIALKPAPFHWSREMIGFELSLWLARILHKALDLRPWKIPVSLRENRKSDPSRRLCEAAVRFIISNFTRPIKVRDTALHVGITSRHLSRLFQIFLHDTPHDLLQRTRLEYSMKLMKASPGQKIKETAFYSGFRNPGYFTRCFKRYFGRPPIGK